MIATGLPGGLAVATARMDQVLDGLKAASPEALECCAGITELACRELAGAVAGAARSRDEAAELMAAKHLRTKIGQARCLLDNVYRFHAGWGQLLGARTGGYLPGGQAAPVPGANRLWLRG